jgi:hypothetical protein
MDRRESESIIPHSLGGTKENHKEILPGFELTFSKIREAKQL